MEIKSKIDNPDGTTAEVVYTDARSFDDLDRASVRQVYGVCFLGDEMLIVFNGKRKAWGLAGGTIEDHESYEECLKRELLEEANVRMTALEPVGYQTVMINEKQIIQLRYVCSAEQAGPFVADPGESITEMKLIDPTTYKQYFDWGEIGHHIITKAIEVNSLGLNKNP